jgi:integrase
VSFARAYTIYLKKHKPLPYYGTEILEYIGETMCHEIDDGLMVELADELWPDDAAPATLNRHLYTPVIAILRMALGKAAPDLVRPAGHNRVMPVHIPPASWYTTLIPAEAPGRHLNPRQLALVMFLAGHGRRLGEALARRPKDLDVATGILDLGRTKTGVRQVELHPRSLALITAIPGWDKQDWLFGAGPTSANSIRRDLRAACVRAGLDWYHPHAFGRHSSVTRMLRRGYSVAHVADAHGMTPEMVTRRYGHLARRESTAALHETGDELFSAVLPTLHNGGNVGEIPSDLVAKNTDKNLKTNDNLPS